MKKRWIAAGMLEAERTFRRIKGRADVPPSSPPSPEPSAPTLSHLPTTLLTRRNGIVRIETDPLALSRS